jgi:uncharacterized protein YydD (DUF2326 family)
MSNKYDVKRGAKSAMENKIINLKDECKPIIDELKKEMNIIDVISNLTPEQLKAMQTAIKLAKKTSDDAIDLIAELEWRIQEIDETHEMVQEIKEQNEEILRLLRSKE